MYWTCMVLMVCNSRITAISLAFMRALPNLGTAMARIIKMIAMTIRSSISEKPRARRRFENCTMTIIMTRNLVAACRRFRLRPTLLEFRATGVRRLGGPILSNEPVLAGKKSPVAGSTEHLRIRMDRIAFGCRGHDEHVPVFVTRYQRGWNEIGTVRPQFGQRGGKPLELRLVLDLHGVNGLQLANHCHLVGVHAVAGFFGCQDHRNTQHDRDDDQRLDQPGAACAAAFWKALHDNHE